MAMFNKRKVIDFLYDVIKDEELEIYPFVKYVSMDGSVPCQNKISSVKDEPLLKVCELSLNRKFFSSNYSKHNTNILKAMLLHEIGHVFFANKSKIDNELFAHLWAIEKANKMGLTKVVSELILIILEWGDIKWSYLEGRRYLLAYKKFLSIVKDV